MQTALHTAITAAREAAKIIFRNLERVDSLSIHAKKKNDFVSEVDHQAEREIISIISRTYPNHSILAEESGHSHGAQDTSGYQWIIDPLDGTTNYLHGFPHFSVSIALRYRQRLETGVIYDPLRRRIVLRKPGKWRFAE